MIRDETLFGLMVFVITSVVLRLVRATLEKSDIALIVNLRKTLT